MGRRVGGEEEGPPLAAKNNRNLLTNPSSDRLAFVCSARGTPAEHALPLADRPVTLALRSLARRAPSDAALRCDEAEG